MPDYQQVPLKPALYSVTWETQLTRTMASFSASSLQGPVSSSDDCFSTLQLHEERISYLHHHYSEGDCSKSYSSLYPKMLIEFLVQDIRAKDTERNPCPQEVYT